jgi:hypothetical protein
MLYHHSYEHNALNGRPEIGTSAINRAQPEDASQCSVPETYFSIKKDDRQCPKAQ